LWFIHQFETGSLYDSGPVYHNIPLLLEIRSREPDFIDVSLLEKSVRAVVNRHEALRTRMRVEEGRLFQDILPGLDVKFEQLEAGEGTDAVEIALERARQPFSLNGGPMLRMLCIKRSDRAFLLSITCHHLVADRCSLDIITREFISFYRAFKEGTPLPSGDVPFHYADFSEWQRQLPEESLEPLFFFWKRQLYGLTPLELPADRPRAAVHIFHDAGVPVQFPKNIYTGIEEFCRAGVCNSRDLLLAAFYVLLYRWTGQEDIAVGTSADNRSQPGLEQMVGPAANLLVLRSRIQQEDSLIRVLNTVQQAVEEAFEHQDLPFDRLAGEMNPDKDMSRTVFFDILFQYRDEPADMPGVPGLSIRSIDTNLGWGKYDLNILVLKKDGDLSGTLVYNRDYYESATISRLLSHYYVLLENILKDPSQQVSRLALLTAEERRLLVEEWNRTEAQFPADKTLHQLIEEQAERTPDHIALVGADNPGGAKGEAPLHSICISFKELMYRADQLAYNLSKQGIGPDTIVAVMMERSISMIAALLGVLKAGGAYLPIDPDYPQERIRYMLEDSAAHILVTAGANSTFALDWEMQNCRFSIVDCDRLMETRNHMHLSPARASSLAYVIYTSGTTGYPKGCLITHRNLVRLFKTDCLPFRFGTDDVWIMAHSFCFDFSVWEMYGALLFGGKLVIPGKEEVRDSTRFYWLIRQHGVTVLNQTPASFYALLEVGLADRDWQPQLHLRCMIFGGDRLSPAKLGEWSRRCGPDHTLLVNMYGITETTVHVTYYRLIPEDILNDTDTSPIGKPLPETTLYILDGVMNPLPVGIGGEIYVGGSGVARGYLNRVELTAQRFIADPFQPGKTLYKTGDLAKRLPDGNIVYLGRNDLQVKIRGYRIETGEIEHRLSDHESVKQAVVIARQDQGGRQKYLCAYIVPSPQHRIDSVSLKQHLAGSLPDYMIPSFFIPIDRIPLTSNRKVDKQALPEPGKDRQDTHRPLPDGKEENMLADIWGQVLGAERESLGMDTSFFDIGGHSLNATTMIAAVFSRTGVKIPLVEVFKTPFIPDLARYIRQTSADIRREIPAVEEREYYPLSSTQKRIYVLQQLAPDSTAYNIPGRIPLPEEPDRQRLEESFNRLVLRHESLRTSFRVVDGEPVQVIQKKASIRLDYYEVPAETYPGLIRPFDLSCAPLLRAGVLKSGGQEYSLLLDIHHIITDAASQDILTREFLALYRGETLPPVQLHYRDFSEWQRSRWQQETLARQEAYWLKEFGDEIPVLDLPGDFHRPPMQSFDGNTVSFAFNERETAAVKTAANEHGLTLYMGLLVLLNLLLSKLGNQEDIVIGTPVAARRHTDLQQIIGMMVNTLAMRQYPNAEKSLAGFMEEVKQRTLEAFENQEYPFEELVEHLEVNRDTSRNPVFDVMLNLLPGTTPADSTDSIDGIVDTGPYDHQESSSRFDLTFSALDAGKRLIFIMEYSTKLFKPSTIERFIRYLKNLCLSLTGEKDRALWELDMIPAEEREEILRMSCGPAEQETPLFYRPIHRLLEDTAAKYPGKTALVFKDAHLSYGELNSRANRLARVLEEKGVTAGPPTALMMERSTEMIIGVLAILKAGGCYLPIDPQYPQQRILDIMEDAGVTILLSHTPAMSRFRVSHMKGITGQPSSTDPDTGGIVVTPPRPQIRSFDSLPIPDRTLVDYTRYHHYIGEAPAKNSITLQTSRGCPYHCLYCHKLWPNTHVVRSAENMFKEISYAYDAGLRRFVFIDDIFNLDRTNSTRFLEKICRSSMDIQLFFPNGFRADLLDREFIDLLVAAGTVNLDVALESASPRIQKSIKKHLHLEKFRENVCYIAESYPQVILEMEMIHGFPSETEAEAEMTLDFLKSIKWVHFPNLHILKIFPNTDIYKLALEHGITREAIERSADLAYHQLPDTLPFPKSFTRQFQARFMGEYFLDRERLLRVLPRQMEVLTEDELVQKYDSYLSSEIKSFDDILHYTGISMDELAPAVLNSDDRAAPQFSQRIREFFPAKEANPGAFRILLLDLSQLFSSHSESMLHHQVEEPLGLMYLLTYLNERFGPDIRGKIAKARIDFDSYAALKKMILEFDPHLIGIRTLTFYKEFFHETVAMIRQWGVIAPIAAGGPYATSDYRLLLQDNHVDLAVLGEGETTLGQLVEVMLETEGMGLPEANVLEQIPGIAFAGPTRHARGTATCRELVLVDQIPEPAAPYPAANSRRKDSIDDLLYTIYTSGSTGKPKGVVLNHRSLVNLIRFQSRSTAIDFSRVLQFATIAFDVSAQEIFSTLLAGGRLLLVDQETRTDIPELFKAVEKECIKTLFLPASFLKFISHEEEYRRLLPRSVAHIVTAGEQAVINDSFKRCLVENGIVFHNHYGPSESHVVTSFTLEPDAASPIPELPPIGRPLLNTGIFILDKGMQPVPVGVPGELCISGSQVGLGYLNNPELTAEKFVSSHLSLTIGDPDDQCPMTNDRLYRTGDLARWQADKNIQFLGRSDQQVKIRGFRVELSEIEGRLLNRKGIKEAAVLVISGQTGENFLCAYVAANEGERISDAQLRSDLSETLPDYMVPAYFVSVDSIPLTPNGKLDRRALPQPEPAAKKSPGSHAPVSEIERDLARLWAEVLGIEQKALSLEDNFFHLGGHSLKASSLTARIHRTFGVKIALAEIFKAPTLAGLSRYIEAAAKESYSVIEAVEEREYYALSSAQKRLYILQEMDRNGKAYNMFEAIPLPETPDPVRLQDTCQQLIHQHESLRTSFHLVENRPVQRIHEDAAFELESFDLTAQGPGETVDTSGLIRPFDLSAAPLLRVGLLHFPGPRHFLLVDMHHIISDGVSITILVRDFLTVYNGGHLQPQHIRYIDYAQCQNKLVDEKSETAVIKKQEAFWLQEFSEEVPILELVTDFPRPEIQSFEGRTLAFEMDEESTTALKHIALQEGMTLYMVLLSIYTIMLSKISGQEDIVVGTPTAGRRHAGLETVIGMFVNTLALRNRPLGEKSVKEFLDDCKEHTLKAFENQDYPFENLVEHKDINVGRNAGRNPLFDVMFIMHNILEPSSRSPVDRREANPPFPGILQQTSKFDFSLLAVEPDSRLSFSFEYCTRLFKEETMLKFIAYFKRIATAMIKDTNALISQIEILGEAEKKQCIFDFNRVDVGYPADKTIHRLFEEQVERTPNRIAAGESPETSRQRVCLTYNALNQRANRLAQVLNKQGVGPGTIVGLLPDRGVEMIAGVLGILKSCAAYLPIDPEYPEERINFMLKDSSAGVLVTGGSALSRVRETIGGIDLIDMSALNETPEVLSNPPAYPVHPAHMSYVIYTSGSTGRPKGVVVEHRNVVRLLVNDAFQFDFNEHDTWTLFHSIAFDFSVWEMFGALLYGGRLEVVPPGIARNPAQFGQLLLEQKVTVLNQIPGVFNHVAAELMRMNREETARLKLRYVIFGGEALNPRSLLSWYKRFPHIRLINMYGITETTVHVTFKETGEQEIRSGSSNIGTPIPTLSLYVLDKYRRLQPVGVPGELVVGGSGVARGYLNRPELTAEKFIHLDFNDRTNSIKGTGKTSCPARFYCSGDLGIRMPDGDVLYRGRNDTQTKIRGFRIEPGEIENRLLEHPGIQDAKVIVRQDRSDKYLCAYIIPAAAPEEAVPGAGAGFKDFLSKTLPNYMIPSYFVQMVTFPVTPSGKVDRKALPAPSVRPDHSSYTQPRDDVEKHLVLLWGDVLNIDAGQIGTTDNFFDIGGHSLKATVLIAKIRQTFNLDLPLSEVFIKPFIKDMAEFIKSAVPDRAHSPAVQDNHLVLLKPGHIRDRNLFLVHDGTGQVEGYLEFCSHLPASFNCWGLRMGEPGITPDPDCRLEELAGLYIEAAKKIQLRGPYNIAGWSLGGTIAFEMARQLEQAGEEVRFLALIDSVPPFKGEIVPQEPGEPSLLTDSTAVEQALRKARAAYTPSGKISAALHFFKARGTPFKFRKWNSFCRKSMKVHKMDGDHYSMFRFPAVVPFAGVFSSVLEK
jgi:amino acid adenylation domain-containing protein